MSRVYQKSQGREELCSPVPSSDTPCSSVGSSLRSASPTTATAEHCHVVVTQLKKGSGPKKMLQLKEEDVHQSYGSRSSPFDAHTVLIEKDNPQHPVGVHHSPTLMLSLAASVANSSAFS